MGFLLSNFELTSIFLDSQQYYVRCQDLSLCSRIFTAKKVADACNIVLTAHDMGTGQRVPLTGVPYHALDTYLARIINAGHKVAIVEQTSDEPIKGLMTREASPYPSRTQQRCSAS
jgi:hypothetical protein